MATKKKAKTRKRSTKPKKSASKKTTRIKIKRAKPPKKVAKTKPASKTVRGRKTARKKQAGEGRRSRAVPYPSEPRASRSGEQSGDLQGLSRPEAADSESVNELLEEGNAFEADAVIGVEDAESSDEKEVRTHEVLEDDVPGEYLDEE